MVGGQRPIKIALFGSFLIKNKYSLKNMQTTVIRMISSSILVNFFIWFKDIQNKFLKQDHHFKFEFIFCFFVIYHFYRTENSQKNDY